MEIPIVDIKGKFLGTLVLNGEVDEILKTTGVDLVVEYNSKKSEVVAYLR